MPESAGLSPRRLTFLSDSDTRQDMQDMQAVEADMNMFAVLTVFVPGIEAEIVAEVPAAEIRF